MVSANGHLAFPCRRDSFFRQQRAAILHGAPTSG
jgi:hypothetical protein